MGRSIQYPAVLELSLDMSYVYHVWVLRMDPLWYSAHESAAVYPSVCSRCTLMTKSHGGYVVLVILAAVHMQRG